MTSADMIWKRCTTCAIMLTDETAFVSITKLYKARITNNNILQSLKLIMTEHLLARLANCFAPPLYAILGRALTFNGIAGFGILQEQKSRCSGQHIFRQLRNPFLRLRWQILREKIYQFFRPEYHRAEIRRTR